MKRPGKQQLVYVVQSAPRGSDPERPAAVHIEVVKGGEVVYGVRAQGKSLPALREQVEKEFARVRKTVRAMLRSELAGDLKRSLPKAKAPAKLEAAEPSGGSPQ